LVTRFYCFSLKLPNWNFLFDPGFSKLHPAVDGAPNLCFSDQLPKTIFPRNVGYGLLDFSTSEVITEGNLAQIQKYTAQTAKL
jgi:hypothetical protein